jgi:hypothetical protein
LTVALREVRGSSARERRTTPQKFDFGDVDANPPPPRKFRKTAIFSTPAPS